MHVSVVVPVYNAASTVAETLASIQGQSYPHWEALVIDDGSTDDSLAVAVAVAQADPRIRVVSQAHRGASAARNAGIGLAKFDWLLFLDADDWISPVHLEAMTAALASRPELDAVICSWARVYPGGERGPAERAAALDRLWQEAVMRCPFAIHACVVRKQRVEAVGGFDEALETCEEWRLWQKVARSGAQFGLVNELLAFYRMHPRTLSRKVRQVFRDSIKVIEGGCKAEPEGSRSRLTAVTRNDLLTTGIDIAILYWGGVLIGQGEPAESLLSDVGRDLEFRLGSQRAAELLLQGLAFAACKPEMAWPELWQVHRPQILEFLQAVERFTRAPALSERVRRAVPGVVIRSQAANGPHLIEGAYGVSLEVFGDIADLELHDENIDTFVASVALDGAPIGTLVLPVCAGRVPAWVLKDAIADRFARRIVDHLAANVPDAEGLPRERASDYPARLVDILLAGGAASGRLSYDGDAPLAVELTARLPDVMVATGDGLEVVPKIGGIPVGTFHIPAPGGAVSAETLREAIRTMAGFELVRVCLREAVVGRPFAGFDELRRRLRAQAEANGDPGLPGWLTGAALGGRRAGLVGTAASRRAVLPLSPGRGPAVSSPGEAVISTRFIAGSLVRQPDAVRGSLLGRGYFEGLFARSPDPWKYTSPYETVKYEQTMSLLPPGPIGQALEIGCAEGHFTEQLAARVDRLTAADVSQIALERAASRCRSFANISYSHIDLSKDDVGRGFDLIVCSEILYFMGSRDNLCLVARRLADGLNYDGHLVMAHAHLIVDEPDRPGFDWPHPFGAKTISDVFAAQPDLRLAKEIRTPLYRIQAFRKVANRTARPPQAETIVLAEQPAPVPPAVEATVRWHGGRPTGSYQEGPGWARTIPILMYHRIAPPSGGALDRYCVDPGAFADQLAFLRDAGFHPVGWDALKVHLMYSLPLPGRPVILTFDDGYRDFGRFAFPVLERSGFTASVFVCPAHVGGVNAWDAAHGEPLALLDWRDIEDLARSGIGFGSHGLRHSPLTSLSAQDMAEELVRSRHMLEDRIAAPVDVLAYPHGDHNPLTEHLAGAVGYAMGLTTEDRQCRLWDRLTALPRIEVRGDMSFDQFVASVTPEGIDPAAAPLEKLCEFIDRLNRPDLALETVREWAGRWPGNAAMQSHLARLLERQGDPAVAFDIYRRVAELEPWKPHSFVQLALFHDRQGRLAEAIEVALNAAERFPDHAALHYHCGNLLLKDKRPGNAEAALRRALELNPQMAYGYAQLSIACERQGRIAEAVKIAEEAAASFPDNAGLQHRLGSLLLGQDRADEAAAALRRAIDLNPRLAQAHVQLSIACERQGRMAEALETVAKAAARFPDNPAVEQRRAALAKQSGAAAAGGQRLE